MIPESKSQNKCCCLCHQADEESNSLHGWNPIIGPSLFGVGLIILALLEDEPDPKTKGELKP